MSYYSDLNVLPAASMKEIEVAYNNLNLQDLSMDDKIKINKAYFTLSDYNSRRKYDNFMELNEYNIMGSNYSNNNYINIDNFNEDQDLLFKTSFDDNDNNNEIDNNKVESNSKEIINHINKLFIDLNIRLENIEKRIYNINSNSKNDFYKEKQKINTYFVKGKKNISINTNLNNNGKITDKKKEITYDEDGNEIITFTIKNYKP